MTGRPRSRPAPSAPSSPPWVRGAAPVGAFARVDEACSALLLDARVMSVDGRERVEASGALPLTDSVGRGDAAGLGEDVARQLLARGAAEVTDLGATKAPRQSS